MNGEEFGMLPIIQLPISLFLLGMHKFNVNSEYVSIKLELCSYEHNCTKLDPFQISWMGGGFGGVPQERGINNNNSPPLVHVDLFYGIQPTAFL